MEKVTLDLLQRSISVERRAAWRLARTLKAPELKCYTCCETWRLSLFVGQNIFLILVPFILGECLLKFHIFLLIWGLRISSVQFIPQCLTCGMWCLCKVYISRAETAEFTFFVVFVSFFPVPIGYESIKSSFFSSVLSTCV